MTGEDVIRSEPAAEAPDPGLAALALERVSADPRAGEILASPDLFSWTLLGTTNATPGAVVFTDATTSGFARRYYRVLVQ